MQKKIKTLITNILFLGNSIIFANNESFALPENQTCCERAFKFDLWFEPMAVKPFQMPLEFAEATENSSTTISNNNDLFLHPNWSFGFRLGTGIQSQNYPWFFNAEYTYWRNTTNASKSVTGTGIATGPSGPTQLEPKIADTEGRTILLPNAGQVGKVSTRLKYNYDILDLSAGWSCCTCRGLKVIPYGGFRGFWYSTKVREVSSDSEGVSFSVAGDPSSVKNNYHATGIMGGISLDYPIVCNLNFYGSFGGSIVGGRNHNTINFLTTGTADPANVTYDETISLFIHSLEGSFRLNYNMCFWSCNLYVGLGYDVIQWAEVLPHPFRQNSTSPGNATKTSNGLFLQSITASVKCTF